MRRWGCVGLTTGSVVGLLLLLGLIRWVQPAPLPATLPPETMPSDLSLFLSERTTSRLASQAWQEPTTIQFEPGGQVMVTTRVKLAGLKPVVELGLTLERQGQVVISQLHWLQVGWLKIPATWLPPEIVALGVKPGEAITRQLPPQANLVGMTTNPDGITLQLNWVGP